MAKDDDARRCTSHNNRHVRRRQTLWSRADDGREVVPLKERVDFCLIDDLERLWKVHPDWLVVVRLT